MTRNSTRTDTDIQTDTGTYTHLLTSASSTRHYGALVLCTRPLKLALQLRPTGTGFIKAPTGTGFISNRNILKCATGGVTITHINVQQPERMRKICVTQRYNASGVRGQALEFVTATCRVLGQDVYHNLRRQTS
eukprot:1182495-Prorocentrum_minimum.AAC.2